MVSFVISETDTVHHSLKSSRSLSTLAGGDETLSNRLINCQCNTKCFFLLSVMCVYSYSRDPV